MTEPGVKKENRLNRYFPRLNAAANTVYRAVCVYRANGSRSAWRRLFRHHFRIRRPYPAPPFLTAAITSRCPCHCVHCGVNAGKADSRNELTTGQLFSVIDQAKKIGVLQITFTGGEPLLREDVCDLVAYAHCQGLLTRINTSGMLLEPSLVSKLKRAGLSQCAVSIDDADPKIHDNLRGVTGSFERALEGIRILKEQGIPCQINTYAARRSIKRGLERIIALGRGLGVLAVYIILPTRIGRWENAPEEILNEAEKAEVRSLQETTFVHLELASTKTLCGIYKKMIIFVGPQGDVTPCPFVSYSFGRIQNLALEDIWLHHCSNLCDGPKGECPMNIPEAREALGKHVAFVAETLKS